MIGGPCAVLQQHSSVMAFVSVIPVRTRSSNFITSAKQCALHQCDLNVQAPVRMTLSRRRALQKIALAAVAGTASASTSLIGTKGLLSAQAAMYASDTKAAFTTTGDPRKVSTYIPQIEAGYQTLLNLRDNWEAKTEAYDGDVVRRDLGTVGVKSPLFNIRKTFLKAWQIIAETSEDDALIEDLESEWNDVVNGISSVDFQLYSVSFTELRESKESLITQGRAALIDLIAVYAKMLDNFRSVL